MEKSESNSSWMTAIGAVVLIFVSVLATLLCMRLLTVQPSCRRVYANSPDFPKGKPQWDDSERIEIEEKGVQVIRTVAGDRCYISPLNSKGRPLALIRQPLADDLIEQLAGPDAVRFCDQQDTFLLKHIRQTAGGRVRRAAEEEAAKPALISAEPAAGGAKHGLELPYEQRKPRCMLVVLDCGRQVGQEQSCFTWVNGVIKLTQKCETPTQFKVFMTKPPGRILKIAQKQWHICLERRKEGKRC